MPALEFRCPATGQNVEVWYEIDDETTKSGPSIETVVCDACGNVHFVDAQSGHVTGTQSKQDF
jgi:hypothetical protein